MTGSGRAAAYLTPAPWPAVSTARVLSAVSGMRRIQTVTRHERKSQIYLELEEPATRRSGLSIGRANGQGLTDTARRSREVCAPIGAGISHNPFRRPIRDKNLDLAGSYAWVEAAPSAESR